MKIDVNALLGLLVLASTVLGGWIAYLKIVKPPEKNNKDKCEALEKRVTDLEEKDELKTRQMKLTREKVNRIVQRLKDKSSFN